MAEYSSPAPGEVDTTAPFESVKAAVNLFGEIADAKALRFPSAEKRASLELQQLRENLAATKHQLSQAQTAKNSLFDELLETKRLVELKTIELAKVLTSKPSSSVAREADETYSQIEAVSNAVKQKYDSAVANLASTEEEVERLNAEIESSVAAIEQGTNKEEERLLQISEDVWTIPVKQIPESSADTELLTTLSDTVETMKKELAATKVSEEKLVQETNVIRANLQKLKYEIEEARVSESKATKAAEAATQELLDLKSKLSFLTEEKTALAAHSESLRDELAKAKVEVAALKEAESEVYVTSPAVSEELQKVRAELASVMATELKAKETISGVTHALQKVTFEADEARLAAEAALEEAHRTKQELEEARAATFTAESKLQAATREAQAAKASESMAVAELKALTEKASSASPSDPKGGIKSKKEVENLKKRLQEAEDLAEMKVAAALAKVDAAKASEREIRAKLDAAKAEVESNKSLAKQALHRAETAESAKSAIENELRRRRKAGDNQTTTSSGGGGLTRGSPYRTAQTPDRRVEPPLLQTLHRRSLDYTSDHSFVSADVSAESIAQLLQLKVAPPSLTKAGLAIAERSEKLKKNKSFMPKLGSYLSRRKSSVGSTASPR